MVDQLENIIGQPHAVNQLKALIKNRRIPHALLFSGPPGVGKFFTSIQLIKANAKPEHQRKIHNFEEPFVKYIFALPRGKGEDSNHSPTEKLTDKQIEELRSQLELKKANYFHKVQIEGANTIKISSIREIKKFLSLDYSDISYRFIIIEDAHLMNDSSQNALLKSLEEPPEGVIFILITPYEERLLPTIISRCWKIKFNNLSNEYLQKILIENFSVAHEVALKVSLFSNGSIQKAVELVENDMQSLLNSTIQILRFSFGGWFNSAYIELKNATDDFDPPKVKEILNLIQIWLVDIQKNRINDENYYFFEFADTLERFNKNFPNAQIQQISREIDELIQLMDKNILLNVIILNLILRLNSISIWN
ncbi:dna polymerase iii delta prime subunit [hydrocarbon metagenome]|uniref:Dna polymerase iii delta prime subunit n=1 Tax=hydrocarbon metagenome TaxID=938273 RepID=A0A0W8FWR1_9ZZZZ